MSDAAFFGPELFGFLRQLKRHNDREWFARNKARYVEVVRTRRCSSSAASGRTCTGSAPISSPTRGQPAARCSGYIATRGSRRTSVPSRCMSASTSPTRAAKTPMSPCSTSAWSRATASRRRACGILTALPSRKSARQLSPSPCSGRRFAESWKLRAQASWVRPEPPVHRGPQAEGLRCLGRAD